MRAALVTGGTGELGLAIARVLAGAGYALTVNSHLAPEVAAGAGALRAEGHRVEGVVADMGEEREVADLIAAHQEAWGRLDVLVNNAGLASVGPIERIETAALDRLLAVNLRGAALATREALPFLRRAGAEHREALIVNMASLAGTQGVANISIYGATKAGVIALTESTQAELGRSGVRCTALAPGVVDTAMTRGRSIPAERMIPPADVGEAVRLLLRTSPGCRIPLIVCTGPGPPAH